MRSHNTWPGSLGEIHPGRTCSQPNSSRGGLWKAVTLLLGISTREHCRIFLPLYTYNQGDLVRTFKTSCMASWFQHSVTKNPLLSHFTIGDLYRLTRRGNSCKT